MVNRVKDFPIRGHERLKITNTYEKKRPASCILWQGAEEPASWAELRPKMPPSPDSPVTPKTKACKPCHSETTKQVFPAWTMKHNCLFIDFRNYYNIPWKCVVRNIFICSRVYSLTAFRFFPTVITIRVNYTWDVCISGKRALGNRVFSPHWFSPHILSPSF